MYDVGDNIKCIFNVSFIGDITEFKLLLYVSSNFDMLMVLQVNLSICLFLVSGVEITALKVS